MVSLAQRFSLTVQLTFNTSFSPPFQDKDAYSPHSRYFGLHAISSIRHYSCPNRSRHNSCSWNRSDDCRRRRHDRGHQWIPSCLRKHPSHCSCFLHGFVPLES
ncbi:uncharacterized protein [Ptychodera flava]|uniref:uncharacterized protein n=1 Tax=Ptychodera flava TaxID=63121 RepID=UPI00396A88CE